MKPIRKPVSKPFTKSEWNLGDPIPDGLPACQIRVSLEAKVWSLGDSRGFSVGPGVELEVTVPYKHLDRAEAQLAEKLKEILGRRINDATAQIKNVAENL